MNTNEQLQWMKKTEYLNKHVEPKIGMEVKDLHGNKGIIVKIVLPEEKNFSSESHGTLYVWQSDKLGYGADNCEHYSLYNWKEFLRLIDTSIYDNFKNQNVKSKP